MVKLLRMQENISITKDRLTALPDELLVHILSFLPIQDAVRTLLLRRFGNIWTFLPTLEFHVAYRYHYQSLEFITNVLKYHKSNIIDKLVFNAKYGYLEEKLTNLVNVALKKKPKILDIHGGLYGIFDDTLELTNRSIFETQSIVTLKLTNMILNLPRLIRMKSLRTLELHFVEMVDDDLKLLELGCPSLQELIFYASSLEKIHFTASNIKRLKLCWEKVDSFYSLDCPNLKFLHIEGVCQDNLEFIDVSSVTRVRIIDPFPRTKIHQFELLYQKFQNAKVFHFEDWEGFGIFLGSKVSMQLQQCGSKKQDFQLNDLSLLALKSEFQSNCLLGICKLLRYSRFLEELTLYVNGNFFCDCNMLFEELSSPRKMRYLKSVTIHDFEKSCKTLVQLVEFLLKSAVILEKLVIVCNKKDQIYSTKGVEFILEILSLPRASENARVIIA